MGREGTRNNPEYFKMLYQQRRNGTPELVKNGRYYIGGRYVCIEEVSNTISSLLQNSHIIGPGKIKIGEAREFLQETGDLIPMHVESINLALADVSHCEKNGRGGEYHKFLSPNVKRVANLLLGKRMLVGTISYSELQELKEKYITEEGVKIKIRRFPERVSKTDRKRYREQSVPLLEQILNNLPGNV